MTFVKKLSRNEQLLFIAENESEKYQLASEETMANITLNKRIQDPRIHRDDEYSTESVSGLIALVTIIFVFKVILLIIGLHYQDKLPRCFYFLCPQCRP